MEQSTHTATVKRSESLRKRRLEARNSFTSSELTVPAKQRESDNESDRLADESSSMGDSIATNPKNVTVDLKLFYQAHDVEEHFRRSLETIELKQKQQKKEQKQQQQRGGSPGSAFVPLDTRLANREAVEDQDSHQIMVSENSSSSTTTSASVTSSTVTQPPPTPSCTSSSVSSVGNITTVPTPSAPVQYYLNSATGALFASPARMGGVQVPPIIFGVPSGLQQQPAAGSASALQTANSSTSSVQHSPSKPISTPSDSKQKFFSTIPSLAQAGNVFIPKIAQPGATNANIIPMIDNNNLAQLMTASPSPTAINTSTNRTVGGAGGSPVILMGPGNLPYMPPGFFFINPSELSTVQTASAAAAATAGLVNFNSQALQNSSLSSNYVVVPSTAVHIPVNGVTQEQLTTLVQQQKMAQPKSSHSLTSTGQVAESIRKIETRPLSGDPAVTDILPGGGGSVEDHFARALGDQWPKVKQNSNPPQNKVIA